LRYRFNCLSLPFKRIESKSNDMRPNSLPTLNQIPQVSHVALEYAEISDLTYLYLIHVGTERGENFEYLLLQIRTPQSYESRQTPQTNWAESLKTSIPKILINERHSPIWLKETLCNGGKRWKWLANSWDRWKIFQTYNLHTAVPTADLVCFPLRSFCLRKNWKLWNRNGIAHLKKMPELYPGYRTWFSLLDGSDDQPIDRIRIKHKLISFCAY